MKETVEKLQTQLSTNVEELRKSIGDQGFEMKRIQQEIDNLKKAQKAATTAATNAAASSGDGVISAE